MTDKYGDIVFQPHRHHWVDGRARRRIEEANSACRSSLKVQNELNKKLWSEYKFGDLTDFTVDVEMLQICVYSCVGSRGVTHLFHNCLVIRGLLSSFLTSPIVFRL